MMNNAYCILTDYDGTAADTLSLVHYAYEVAVSQEFGQRGLDLYQKKLEGLKNRAPSEVVSDLYRAGVLGNDPGDSEPDPNWVREMTRRLNGTKLSILFDSIGKELEGGHIYPAPMPGFLNFLQTVKELKEAKIDISLGVVSSGHDGFLDRAALAWQEHYGVTYKTDIRVTHDTVDSHHYPKGLNRRVKPGAFPIGLAHEEWLRMTGIAGSIPFNDIAIRSRNRAMYIGDDFVKDGQMAQKAGLIFGHIQNGEGFQVGQASRSFTFGSWDTVAQLLVQNTNKLYEGRPLDEIFLQQHSTIEGAPQQFRI